MHYVPEALMSGLIVAGALALLRPELLGEGEGLAAVEAVGAKVGAILAAVAQEGGPGPVQAAEVVAGTPRRQLDARFASVEKDLELKTAELESRNLVIESLQRELSKVKDPD